MSIFKGHFASSLQENHQFFCDETIIFNKSGVAKSTVKLIKQLGLVTFTKRSCKSILEASIKYVKNTALYSSFPEELQENGGTLEDNETILDYCDIDSIFYTRFNKATLTFEDVKTEISDIQFVYGLIEYHENRQFDDTFAENSELEKKLEEINTSLEKCIIIQTKFFNVGVVQFKLIFQGRKKRSNERSMALSNINVAQVPSTPYHQSFSYSNSVSLQGDGVDQIGAMIPANENNSFSQDKVAGPLSMFFDRNSNTYKSGNAQMLARLLTDIDPAEVEALPDGDLNDIPARDMLSALNGFKTGKALPLSSQEGNPFSFGPDYIDCGPKKIVEITVTNRSLRRFTKGQIVMLTEIGTEWIIQDFGQDSAFESSAKFGDWHFIKLIANTDTYFKDDRYYTTGDFSNTISPSDYETYSRVRFYNNKLPLLSNNETLVLIYDNYIGSIINLNRPANATDSFVPSRRYYVASIFDQLSRSAAGFAGEYSLLVATNVNDAKAFGDPNLQFKYAQELPGFWGPVYADGHSSLTFNSNGRDNNTHKVFFDTSGVFDGQHLKYHFPQSNGNYKVHIPAECSSTFIYPTGIFLNWGRLGSVDISGSGSSIRAPFYGTTLPSTKNSIQFSPLQAELAGSDDLLSTRAKNFERRFYTIIRSVIQAKLGIPESISTFFGQDGGGEGNLAKMYERSSQMLGYPRDEFLITDVSQCSSPTYDDAQASFNEVGNFKSVKYDCFVTRGGRNSGLVGSPALFRKSGADGGYCVGIISAKNTITKKSGGKLNYSINQDFGLNQQRTSTLATSWLTIIPGIFSGGGSAGGGMQYGFPQWGSTTDNINSFGTTALHVRIFDHWPEYDTLFDPRYFGILHLNPNDQSVDMLVPTEEGDPIKLPLYIGRLINSSTKLLPKSSWIKNPIRRGMLLTGGGFKYLAHQIGLNELSVGIVYGGTGFNANFEFEIKPKKVILNVVVSEGSVTSVSIKDGSDIRNHTVAGIDSKHRGINFLPEDFGTNVPKFEDGQLTGTTEEKAYIVNIPSPTPAPVGRGAVVKFTSGEVYFQELIDNPPVEQVPITRLTSSSKRGEGFIQEVKESDFTLEKNKSGKYDCFYHFHNDITHTLMTEQAFIAGFAQYVTMTIT